MKIGVNYKKIMSFINDTMVSLGNTIQFLMEKITTHSTDISSLDTRVTTLENSGGESVGGSDWVEITSSTGQEAEITQEFSEIRLLAKTANANYSVTYSYDSTIFHNKPSNAPTYMICGNPTENNYGCKFKYMLTGTNNDKQYVCVDKCFSGGSYEPIEFRAWIKPVPSGPQ